MTGVEDDTIEDRVINEKYDFIEDYTYIYFLTHRIWSIPVFLCIMALVFFLTFTVGDFLKGYVEIGALIDEINALTAALLASVHASEIVTSLICDGIIAGVRRNYHLPAQYLYPCFWPLALFGGQRLHSPGSPM